MAKHALHLAKPVVPSLRYSYNFQISDFIQESEVSDIYLQSSLFIKLITKINIIELTF